MDEYEHLEEDLQKLYEEYMTKFRNQAYLEQLLDEYNRAEQDKNEVRPIGNLSFLHDMIPRLLLIQHSLYVRVIEELPTPPLTEGGHCQNVLCPQRVFN